ncbi:DNA alkylation repair protein [Treponema sp.]|uniref:DNA alkylation repair protein n=1 Tax=Treponema sp. TaxID=166 RepID=UPI00388FB7E5
MTKIQKKLFEDEDKEYKVFQTKLNPTVDEKTIIGVRVPKLRALAKEIYSDGKNYGVEKFLASLPHKYFEENFIHSFIIEQMKDYDECMEKFLEFLPFIDNWAVCDTCHPKAFKKNSEKVLLFAYEWIKSNKTYTIRYGIDVFMTYFLDENFDPKHLDTIAAIRSDEYYVNMMQAWYFATALAKQWDDAVKIIEGKKLSPWVHNKTIQKARESFRVTDEHKEYLAGLKVTC